MLGKQGASAEKRKGWAQNSFAVWMGEWVGSLLYTHRKDKLTQWLTVKYTCPIHSIVLGPPKATLFLVLLVVTFYSSTKAHRHCFLVCQCKTLSADLWGYKSRFCSFRLLHFPSSLISLFHYFSLWFNLPSVCNYSRPPECSPSEMKSLALTSSWHVFSSISLPLSSIYSYRCLRSKCLLSLSSATNRAFHTLTTDWS